MSNKREHKRRLLPLAEAGSIHSNAYNFLTAVTTGVDPRTGMYSCSISLPGVAANNLCGPTLGLSLRFSMLNPVDAGFGIGWSLTTTRYDTVRRRLSLSSGESFLVDDFDFASDTATFKDRKLRSFDLIRESSGDYRVVHKAGHSEHLTVLSGSDGVAVLHELRSPEGYVVKLDQQAAGGVVKLREIIDGTGRVLLSVDYELDHTEVTMHPASLQAVTFAFRFSNDWLTAVDLPKGYGDGWVFGYEMRRPIRPSLWRRIRSWFVADDLPEAELGLLLLTSVTVPAGGHEEVTYSYEGHALPGGSERPLSHMPYVTRFVRRPGHDQPDVDTGYEYSSRNFFGFGVLNDWKDGEDNLYRVVMPPGQSYEYSSIETLYDGDEPVRTIGRTFNRFHLLTKELTTQEGCVKKVETVYDEDPSASFTDQAPWCQLPVEVHTQYRREDEPGRYRDDVEKSSYDAHGNRLVHVDIQGIREETTYYPVEGLEDSCPMDPLGFVRSAREKRVSPQAGTEGPVRVTLYRHALLFSRQADGPGHVVASSTAWYEVLANDELVGLKSESYAFVDDGGIHHGRPKATAHVVGGFESTTAMTYALEEERNALAEALPVLKTTVSRTGTSEQGSQAATIVNYRSLLDGRQVAEQDARQVVKRVAYDGLGRLIKETASADSAFEASQTKQYMLSHTGSWTRSVDATGQCTRADQDGFGREVRHVAVDWKGDGNDHDIWQASFDLFDRLVSETDRDIDVPLVDSPDAGLILETLHAYDGWNNRIASTSPSGVRSVTLVDPIDRVTDRYDEVSVDGVPHRRGHTRTTSTKSGKPMMVERIDGKEIQIDRRYEYDGLDRCVAETDAIGNITRYAYDGFNRLVRSTLPDSAVVLRTYARHSEEAWLEVLVIQHPSLDGSIALGRQRFDGLGRRTLLRAGLRETTYVYEDGATSPFKMALPSGEEVTCRYEKLLSERLSSLSSEGKMPTESVTFEHVEPHGWLQKASSALGTQTMDYLPSGRLAKTTFDYDGQSRSAICSAYTLMGELTRFTGVDGDERRLSFDTLGRLARQESGVLITELGYDAFGKLSSTATRTVDGSRATVVTVDYDVHGREAERVVVCESAGYAQRQVLTQAYTETGRLKTRKLVTDEGVREEHYDYDMRGRLVDYRCDGINAPVDASGFAIAEQRFTFDALDNIREVVTRFVGGLEPERVSTYRYAKDEPTQLEKLIDSQAGRPDVVLAFAYDRSGNLLVDEAGRQLQYDALGRLIGWTHGPAQRMYRYDPLDRIGCVEEGGDRRYRYYDGDKVAYEASEKAPSSFHCVSGSMVAQIISTGAVLLGWDAQGSVVGEASVGLNRPVYTAYGHRAKGSGDSDIAFAGELSDSATGCYFLGSYRMYNPRLMRFHSPDSASPFGEGGLNGYAYCGGDPVNRVDPTGQSAFGDFFADLAVPLFGLAMIAVTVAGFGGLTPVTAAFYAAFSTVRTAADVAIAATVTAATAGALFDTGAMVAARLGEDEWEAGLSVVGMTMGLAAGLWANRASKLIALPFQAVNRTRSTVARSATRVFREVSRVDKPAADLLRFRATSPASRSGSTASRATRSTSAGGGEAVPTQFNRNVRVGIRRPAVDDWRSDAMDLPSTVSSPRTSASGRSTASAASTEEAFFTPRVSSAGSMPSGSDVASLEGHVLRHRWGVSEPGV